MAQSAPITEEPLYDRVFILSTTSPVDLFFFTTPKGLVDPNTTGAKTYADTNMTQASRLPNPESFDIESIQLIFDMAATIADETKYFNTSWIEIANSAGSNVAWRGPAKIVLAGAGLVAIGGPTSANVGQNGYSSVASIMRFQIPIRLDVGETFFVKSSFSAVQSLAADNKVHCVLGGKHYTVYRPGGMQQS